MGNCKPAYPVELELENDGRFNPVKLARLRLEELEGAFEGVYWYYGYNCWNMLGLYPERSYDFELEASKLVELSDRLRKKFSITVAVADNWYEDNGFWFLPLGEALPPNSNAATLSFLMEMLDDAKGRHEAERARIRLADAHFGLPEQPLSTSAADDNDIEF